MGKRESSEAPPACGPFLRAGSGSSSEKACGIQGEHVRKHLSWGAANSLRSGQGWGVDYREKCSRHKFWHEEGLDGVLGGKRG